LEIFNPSRFNFTGIFCTLEDIIIVRIRLKYRIGFLFLLLLLCHITAWTQANLEPQQKEFQSAITDSVRIQTILKLSSERQYFDLNEASDLANEALSIANQKNWTWAQGLAYKQLSFLASISGDYTTAIKLDNSNLQLALSQKDSFLIADALNYLGNDYNDLSIYDESYFYFTQSYQVAKAIHDTLRMAVAIYNVGRVLTDVGQFELALNHFDFSRRLSQQVNDMDGFSYLDNAIGEVYLKKKDFKRAEKSFKDALSSVRSRNLTIIEPRVTNNLARLKFELKEYEKALAYYDSSIQLYQRASNEFGITEVNLGISKIYIEQNKFNEALSLIEQSLITAKNNNARKMELDCYSLLSSLAERKGDYKNALSHLKTYKLFEDSLYSREMQEKLFQDQLRLQTEFKDLRIAELSRTNAQQDSAIRRQELTRNILVVVFALTAILLFTVYRSSQRRIRINKLLVEHQKEIKKRSDELEQLNKVKDKFFSIISHDLRSPINALSAILELAEKEQLTASEFKSVTKDLRKQFNHARTLINNLLDWALLQMDNLQAKAEEVDLANIIDENVKLLENQALKDMKLVNMVPSGIKVETDLNMFNLVLRNLIMNAIKFSEAGGIIEIATPKNDEHFVTVSVKDYGIGISKEVQKLLFDKTQGYSTRGTANEKGTGLGLILCKEFVEKNGGKIWFESEEGLGSTFYFTIKKSTHKA
jgi:signal transduction histidine kinase